MFVSDKDKMVHAYRLLQGRPFELEGSPAWLQEAALGPETGEMRIALRHTGLDATTTLSSRAVSQGQIIKESLRHHGYQVF